MSHRTLTASENPHQTSEHEYEHQTETQNINLHITGDIQSTHKQRRKKYSKRGNPICAS